MLATELMVADLPERQLLLDPILTSNTLALLYGPRGLGKTFVALGIAWAAASGASFLGWQAKRPHRVLYIDGEMAGGARPDGRGKLGRARGDPPGRRSSDLAQSQRVSRSWSCPVVVACGCGPSAVLAGGLGLRIKHIGFLFEAERVLQQHLSVLRERHRRRNPAKVRGFLAL
jgi:AAA domain